MWETDSRSKPLISLPDIVDVNSQLDISDDESEADTSESIHQILPPQPANHTPLVAPEPEENDQPAN